ncbi:MAG: hypothetical protein KAR38_17410 [Calditrichia bacterium]|nr:hypothetical protein [Calditrichia bacterium]
MINKTVLSTLLILLFLLTGCKDSTKTEKDTPPSIPPQSSFIMSFADFDSTSQAFKNFQKTASGHQLYGHNWAWSAWNVGIWNLILTIGLAVPTASFVEAFNHTPEQQQDGSWIWSYNFNVLAIPHSAQLKATIDAEGVDWEMRISRAGAYTDFLWYTGHNNLTLTEGTWTLNNNHNNPTPLLGILWHRDLDNETANIKYTNIVPGGAENGGYIFYGTDADSTYDAFYDIFNKGLNNLTEIEWNLTTKEGHVKDSLHFGDENWHCWDSDLNDMVCE